MGIFSALLCFTLLARNGVHKVKKNHLSCEVESFLEPHIFSLPCPEWYMGTPWRFTSRRGGTVLRSTWEKLLLIIVDRSLGRVKAIKTYLSLTAWVSV